MFNIRQLGFCIVLFANAVAMPQAPTELTLVDTASSAGKTEIGVSAKTLSSYRVQELKRGAHDPGTSAKAAGRHRAEYSKIVSGHEPLTQNDILRIKNTKGMPPTSCKSVHAIPKDVEHRFEGPWRAHELSVYWFSSQSGFGYVRMVAFANARGQTMGAPGIDRVELVSLLTSDEPSVYVLDQVATPSVARLARRRPLDEFEQLGLDAVRHGEDLVSTKEAPDRMFGAIRAAKNCLECHTGAKENDLLGAFTYYLETSVDKLR